MINVFPIWRGMTMPQALHECKVAERPVSMLFDSQDRPIVRSQDPVPYGNSDNVSAYGMAKWVSPFPEAVIPEGMVSSVEAEAELRRNELRRGIEVHNLRNHPAILEHSTTFEAPTAEGVEDKVIAEALKILQGRANTRAMLDSPSTVKDLLTVAYSDKEHEIFTVLFLDAKHRLIQHMNMFTGTLTQTSVYPREVVKAALQLNAAAVILCHNHPSGDPEPSRADELLTDALKKSLALIDVRVIDHVVVAGGRCMSFAEKGLL